MSERGTPEEPAAPTSTEVGEMLDSGQEEVFSRTEVELGRIEHCSEAGRKHAAGPPPTQAAPEQGSEGA